MNMNNTMTKEYKEVYFDRNGREHDRFYKNPLAGLFQREYALYLTAANLFESVRCRSMCIDTMKLYFMELAHKEKDSDAGNKNRNTQEDLLSEMERLVNRDVIGHITFPMMHICAAEAKTVLEEDGSHGFIFTDGIYGFKLHLDNPGKGHPRKIEVTDLCKKKLISGNREIRDAAPVSAA
ncbi:MAG: hypothetical protein K6F86_00915 [Lachnospiraceae bacterium]|nr:hypothetical protein [Lachnospiraceae bacterium]